MLKDLLIVFGGPTRTKNMCLRLARLGRVVFINFLGSEAWESGMFEGLLIVVGGRLLENLCL